MPMRKTFLALLLAAAVTPLLRWLESVKEQKKP